MNVSENNSEKLLVIDLLLSNGFKAQNIPNLTCHVTLSISMNRYKRNDYNSLVNFEIRFNQ